MSAPEKNKFRVCVGNHKLFTEKFPVKDSTCQTLQHSVTGTNILLDDPNGKFVTNGVRPGDEVVIESGALAANSPYIVDKTLTESRLQVLGEDAFASLLTDVPYSIRRELTKTQQAEELKAVSEGLGSKRCIMTFPDKVEID